MMNDELIQINADQYKGSKAIKRKIDKRTFTNILSKQRRPYNRLNYGLRTHSNWDNVYLKPHLVYGHALYASGLNTHFTATFDIKTQFAKSCTGS